MNDFLYDIKRTLFGKFTIIMIVLVVLLSLGISYATLSSSSASSAPPSAVATVMPDIYPTHGGFMIVDYAVNGYGKPVSGLSINSNVTNFSSTNKLEVIQQFNGVTNSKGFVSFQYNTTDKNVTYRYWSSYAYGKGTAISMADWINVSGSLSFSPGGPNSGLYKQNVPNYVFILPVKNPNSDLPNSFLIYYAGPNSTHPPNMKVYYNVTPSGTSISSSSVVSKNTTYFGTISKTNNTIVTLPVKSNITNGNLNIMVTYTNDTVIAYNSVFYSVINSNSVIDSIIQIPYEFLIPILGIFSAYFYYGKDKASGVLDSVIVRPVTKGRVFLSRFIASAVSFFVALILSLALMDFVVYKFTNAAMSSTSFFEILLGYFAVAIAYAGIIYVISQFTKSQGAILGSGIGIFFLFVFIWGIIVALLSFYINTAIAGSYVWIVALSSISPSFIPTLVTYFRTGLFSSYVTIYSLLLVGIVWACVPAVISFFLARNRD